MVQRIADGFSDSFSKAVVVPMGEHSLVFISGQVGHPPDGPVKVTAEPFEEEAKLCMGNVERALKNGRGACETAADAGQSRTG